MKTTIISALVIIGMTVTLCLSECFAGGQKVSPEQLPINLSGIYGVPNNTADVWPIWSLQVVWYRSGAIYGDHVGPFLVQLQLNRQPTLGDVAKYVRQPDGLPGKWKPAAIYNIVQVGEKEPEKQPEDEIRN